MTTIKTTYACPVTNDRVEDRAAHPPVRDGHATGLESRFEEEIAKVMKQNAEKNGTRG
jgi:hypothetical protein